MKFFNTVPARCYIISTPLTFDRIQDILKAALDRPPVPLNFLVARTEKSYIGYGDSFQYDETSYNPRTGSHTMTAIGTMERISEETRLQVDYSCDLGQFEIVYPILYIFSGLIAFLGVIILLRLDIDGLILVAAACVPYGIVRLVVFYYNTVLDGLHGRIMRILKKG